MEEASVPETSLMKAEQVDLEDVQIAEQLYSGAGLGPVVDAGLKDYDETIKKENKLINKVLGPREGDIKGYGEAVAKRVAYAVYSRLNQQYGGKMGNLRDYIMNLEDERNRANTRYDELMGRVIGMLGEEYKQLRTDSKEFMERLNTTLGEDLKTTKFDQKALAERLADIDGLRKQIDTLENDKKLLAEKYTGELSSLKERSATEGKELGEKHAAEIKELTAKNETLVKELVEKHAAEVKEMKERYESQAATARAEYRDEIKELKNETKEAAKAHNDEVKSLESRIASLEENVKKLTGEKQSLTSELEALHKQHDLLAAAVEKLTETVPHQEIGDTIGEETFSFILHDSKVPDAVIEGVGKFIDFRKYLKMAASQAAEKALGQARDSLKENGV